MDRSNRILQQSMKDLVEAMSQRSDGYWELLATAAGSRESLAKTTRCLSAEELGKGGRGLAVAPSIVSERVEALATWDPGLLRELSQDWVTPDQAKSDPWWMAAWKASVRHLRELGDIQREFLDVQGLSEEINVLWSTSPQKQASWHALLRDADYGAITYRDIRVMARSGLVEEHLSGEDLAPAPPMMFRLLRGMTSRLDSSARRVVSAMAKTCLERDPFEAAIIVEIANESSPRVSDSLRVDLAERLRTIEDPRAVIPVAYVLLERGWHVP